MGRVGVAPLFRASKEAGGRCKYFIQAFKLVLRLKILMPDQKSN